MLALITLMLALILMHKHSAECANFHRRTRGCWIVIQRRSVNGTVPTCPHDVSIRVLKQQFILGIIAIALTTLSLHIPEPRSQVAGFSHRENAGLKMTVQPHHLLA